MRLKTITFGLALLLTLSTASALQVDAKQDTYNISAGNFIDANLDVVSANGTVSVESTQKSTPEIGIAPQFFNNKFQQGDTIPFQFSASSDLSPGNYTVNVTLKDKWKVEKDNNTNTTEYNTSTDKAVFNLVYQIPYRNVFDQTVDKGETIEFVDSGFTMTLGTIQENKVSFTASKSISCLTVKDSGCKFTVQGTEYKIKAVNTYPSRGFADIEVSSTSDVSVRIQKSSGGKIQVKKSFPSEPIIRGQSFEFQTVDNASGKRVPNVKVRFRGNNYGTLGRPTTGQFGYGTVKIPEQLSSNKIRYQVLAVSSKKDYELGSGIFTLPTSYQSYLKSNNLTFANLPENIKIGKEVTSKLITQNGKVKTDAQVVINTPSGKITRGVNNNGQFSFTLSNVESGTNITIQGVRTAMESSRFNTEKVELTVIGDQDKDNILDHKDKCDSKEGPKENNGCPLKEVTIKVTQNGEEVEKFKPKTSYTVKLMIKEGNETRVAENISGTLKVENSTGGITEYDVQQGVTQIGFAESGDYSLRFNKQSVEEAEMNIEASQGGNFPIGKTLAVIAFMIILVFLAYLYFETDILGGGGSGGGSDVGVEGSMSGRTPNQNQQRRQRGG